MFDHSDVSFRTLVHYKRSITTVLLIMYLNNVIQTLTKLESANLLSQILKYPPIK